MTALLLLACQPSAPEANTGEMAEQNGEDAATTEGEPTLQTPIATTADDDATDDDSVGEAPTTEEQSAPSVEETEASTSVPAPTLHDAGAPPRETPSQTPSLGAVQFTFSAPPQRYCGDILVNIEDEDGNLLPVGASTAVCGGLPCDTCVSNEPCAFGDVYIPIRFVTAGMATWSGDWVSGSMCTGDGAQHACLASNAAPRGRYTAVFCGALGQPHDLPPDECTSSGMGESCVRVPFDYPETLLVTGELP